MEKDRIKIFYLKRKVIFPFSNLSVIVKPSEISKNIKSGDTILSFPIRSFLDLFFYRGKIATLASVIDVEIKDETIVLNLKGLSRVKLTRIYRYRYAEYNTIDIKNNSSHDDFNEELRKKSQELIFLINVEESDLLINLIKYIVNLDQLTDFISNYFIIDFKLRYKVYKELDIQKRGNRVLKILNALISSIIDKRKKEEK